MFIAADLVSLKKKFKDQNRALHSSFLLFYTIKAPNGKLTFFRHFFFSHPYSSVKILIRFLFQSLGSVYEVTNFNINIKMINYEY